MSLDPALQTLVGQPPNIRPGDSDATMLLRLLDAVGFDPVAQAWYAEPEGLPSGLLDTVRSVAAELNRRAKEQPTWADAIDRIAREVVVLVRARESAPEQDRSLFQDMIVSRQEELDKLFGHMNEVFG